MELQRSNDVAIATQNSICLYMQGFAGVCRAFLDGRFLIRSNKVEPGCKMYQQLFHPSSHWLIVVRSSLHVAAGGCKEVGLGFICIGFGLSLELAVLC